MHYTFLNAVRVVLSYIVMLAFAAWAYQRFFTFSAATSVSLLYIFAFVPLPAVRLWKRLVYITLAALPSMIIPIGYSVVFLRADNLNAFWEAVQITFLVGLLGPQYIMFLIAYSLLEPVVRRMDAARKLVSEGEA
ncbi:hypothetical protein [Ensifer sp. B1-9]|uniref:hypothetical protein n=1 Tax=Ensifer sp. B1-9 TaxID=3141455 RepID=UPI003D1C2C6F